MIAEFPPATDGELPIGGSALQRRIADAAIELFYQRGALATTVRDITGACGLTPGALYNHFASKDHLVYVLIRDIHRHLDARLRAALADAGPDPVDQLVAIVALLVAHTAGFKKQSRVANREFTILTGAHREEIMAMRRQMRDGLTGILLAGARQGAFSLVGGDDQAAATVTSGIISTICVRITQRTLASYPGSIAELQDDYVSMTLRLVGVR